MLNISLEEDPGMFSPVCLCVLPQALQPYRAPCHRKGLILILSKLLRDSIMQHNANIQVLQVCFISYTHTHTKDQRKNCRLEQHCLTLLFCLFYLCAPSVCWLFLCVGEISGCKGNDIWEILSLLMNNTTKPFSIKCSCRTKSRFRLVISQCCLDSFASREVSQGPLDWGGGGRSSNSV